MRALAAVRAGMIHERFLDLDEGNRKRFVFLPARDAARLTVREVLNYQ